MADKDMLEGGTKQKASTDTEFATQSSPQRKKLAITPEGSGSVWSAAAEQCELSEDDSFLDQHTDHTADGGELEAAMV